MPLKQLHIAQVSVAAQADIVVGLLRNSRSITFRSLTEGTSRLITVARFLALLELFRLGQVGFQQVAPFGELTIGWTGGDTDLAISDEFDRPEVAQTSIAGQPNSAEPHNEMERAQ